VPRGRWTAKLIVIPLNRLEIAWVRRLVQACPGSLLTRLSSAGGLFTVEQSSLSDI
jgi:hypothetical protein